MSKPRVSLDPTSVNEISVRVAKLEGKLSIVLWAVGGLYFPIVIGMIAILQRAFQ